MLETVGVDIDGPLLDAWRERVVRLRTALGWPDAEPVARVHARGASLALPAPLDQLFSATEVNEWALLAALFSLRDRTAPDVPCTEREPDHALSSCPRKRASMGSGHSEGNMDARFRGHDGRPEGLSLEHRRREAAFHAPGHPAAWDEDSALHTLRAFARAERNPPLLALVDAARARGLTVLVDDDTLSVGIGKGARCWPLAQLPAPDAIEWDALHDAPVALVTGSNGKTTTTRLLAAFARAHGARVAYTSTDGVVAGAATLAAGDYSGPAGARVALRAPGIDCAILETARGGILRRGIAVQQADVAVVTNVSDDHFGEYGVHDLDDLAAVKLAVARTLGSRGVLVLNADDAQLVRHAPPGARIAWFALDADAPALRTQRARGGSTCGVRDGRLWLHEGDRGHDLGAVADMPLTHGGAARYNIGNIAAAALAAAALGIAPSTLQAVLARFGAARGDNPGRLQHWSVGGVAAFVDYAHNPDGLRGLLEVATPSRGRRLGLVLGQAGNREDNEIRELAAAAAAFRPDRVVLKDIGGMLRGRAPGEVPALLREELRRRGIGEAAIVESRDEYAAVREALAWARTGDVLVLPIHGNEAKPKVAALLDALQAAHWQAGSPLPP